MADYYEEDEELENEAEEDYELAAEVSRVNAIAAELNRRLGVRILPKDPEHKLVAWNAPTGDKFLESYAAALEQKAKRTGAGSALRQAQGSASASSGPRPAASSGPRPAASSGQRPATGSVGELMDARELIQLGLTRELGFKNRK